MNKADALAAEKDRVKQKFGLDDDSDQRVLAWLLDAVLAKLDAAAHAHTCEPVWRPVTRVEIQPGWEVRSRRRDGSEVTWGIAHHRGDDNDWYTETGALLTYRDMGWTYETAAPKPEAEPEPEPEPEPDQRLTEALNLARAALSILDALGDHK